MSEIKYDRSKDRQGLFDEKELRSMYKEELYLLDISFTGAKASPNSPPAQIPPGIYTIMMTEYTAGYPIESLRERFESAMAWSQTCLDINKAYPDDDYTMMVWGISQGLDERLSNAIGLSILFNRTDWLSIVKQCYEVTGFDDPAFSALINMMIPTEFDPKQRFAPGGYIFRKPLLQAILAESKKDTLKHLNAYLAGWYDGHRKIGGNDGFIDAHLAQDACTYYGYWSFEAAAVVYLKDIDDTSLREYLYYPKDMIDWARAQKLKNLQSEDRPNHLPLLLNRGASAPFSGKYGPDNFIGHEILLKQGEKLPAGQVSAVRDGEGNPVYRSDTVWRLLSREGGGSIRFSEAELKQWENNL